MANRTAPVDVYALMNEIAEQATGRQDLRVVDTSTFTTVGETLLRTATENTLNAISQTLAKTIFSVRPYKGKLDSLRMSQERWGGVIRKLVPLYKGAEQSEDWNTVSNPNQLADGNSVDMYKINKPVMLQLNFYGTNVLQKHITRFRDQLAQAFSSESEFMRFVDAVMVEFANEIEILNEEKARGTLLNFMAGISSMGLTEKDLVAEFNTENGTTYTRAQLLTTYLTEFMQFVASTIKTDSSKLTDMSVNNHANITGYAPIMRHTPKERQKLIMYEPFMNKIKAGVFSEIFNPKYLEIGDYEGVNYWQSQNDPTAIHVKPNILDVATGNSKTAETDVELDYVLGLLFDDEAVGVLPQYDYSSVTPFNSAGGYYNLYMHWRFMSVCDYTMPAILYVLGEGGE